LRFTSVYESALTPLSGFATPGYVLLTVAFTVWLVRAGMPLARFGFEFRPVLRTVILFIAAVVVLRLLTVTLQPLIEGFIGSERNLERFAGVEGSASALAGLLALNWSFAAFGEEFAYRIVLMRGIAYALGDSRVGLVIALVLQAVIFGLVHAYQGPAGVVGAAVSGLVFGAVTLAARWSIWPAALAHGTNNTIGILDIYQGL